MTTEADLTVSVSESATASDSNSSSVVPPSRLGRFAVKIKQFTQRHLFLLLAAAVGCYALGCVPQVRNLWQQSPPMSLFLPWVQYVAFILVLSWFYVPAWFAVVQGLETVSSESPPERRRFVHILRWPTDTAVSWMPTLAERMPWRKSAFAGMMLIILGAVAWNFGGSASSSRLYPLAGAFCRYTAVTMVAVGCWSCWPSLIGSLGGSHGLAWGAVGRVMSWGIVGGLIGEAIWVTASLDLLQSSFRLYSVWALVHFFTCLVLAGSLTDYCHRRTRWPARQLVLVLLVLVVWAERPQPVHDATSAPPTTAGNGPDWYSVALRRLKQMPPGPVVLVAASGGGSRAAIYTGLVLDHLSREPMDLPEVSPQQDTSQTEGGNWADHILLISSVSGGSLATAEFVANDRGGEGDERPGSLISSNRVELLAFMKAHLQDAEQSGDREDPQLDNIDHGLRWIARHQAGQDQEANWVLNSALADDMAMDFMAPILRGIHTPYASRSDTLSHFWDEQFGWKGLDGARWNAAPLMDQAARPLVLINTCDLDRGARIAIGFPSLPEEVLRTGAPEDDPLPGESQAFSALGSSGLKLGLARAVRFSSNFPWGFPVSYLDRTTSPSLNSRLRFVDGGVVDNTGIDTIHDLLLGLDRLARQGGPDGVRPQQILDELRRRGVALIEINSGAQPVGSAGFPLLRAIQQPIRGLNNAGYSNAVRAKRRYTVALQEQLRTLLSADRLQPQDEKEREALQTHLKGRRQLIPATVFHHEFRCNHVQKENAEVMTAWALGPRDKAVVVAQFLVGLPDWISFRNTTRTGLQAGARAVVLEGEAARLAQAEYRLKLLTASLAGNEPVLRELREHVRNRDFQEAVRLRNQLVAVLSQQRSALREAEVLVPSAARNDDLSGIIEQLRKTIGHDIGDIAVAKGLDPKEVERMVGDAEQIAGGSSFASATGRELTRQIQLSTEELLRAREIVENVHWGNEQRAIDSQKFWTKQSLTQSGDQPAIEVQ